jgi:hypothetical protein
VHKTVAALLIRLPHAERQHASAKPKSPLGGTNALSKNRMASPDLAEAVSDSSEAGLGAEKLPLHALDVADNVVFRTSDLPDLRAFFGDARLDACQISSKLSSLLRLRARRWNAGRHRSHGTA